MVNDGLDWVRVFGYGLEMGERGCRWLGAGGGGGEFEISRGGLKG